MSSCLSGAGRAYTIDLDIVKSPSTSSTRTTSQSSPSSTLSESSNSPIKISTRKPRTPRKRPNQTYNEAAALLSTVYPNIFSIKNLRKPFKHSKPCDSFSEDSSELLPPFPTFCNTELLIHQPIPEKPKFRIESKPINYCEKPCQSPVSWGSPSENFEEDFDTESMLDEEMEEGIDSIMGNLSVNNDAAANFDHPNSSSSSCYYHSQINSSNSFYGNSILGFGGKFDFRGVSALRQVDNGDWWRFPTVDVLDISPKLNTTTTTSNNNNNSNTSTKVPSEKKKKKKKVEKESEEASKTAIISSSKETEDSNSTPNSKLESALGLKLNYEDVLMAWSDRGLPFSDDISSESDAIARLAQIDLFGENGGLREASVLRYREKRRTRLFSKKIRYQVRKVNADRRPRMKGRFVRRPGQHQ